MSSSNCCGRNINGQGCGNSIAKKKSNLTQQPVYDCFKDVFCSAHLLKLGRDFDTHNVSENIWKKFNKDQVIEFQHSPSRDVGGAKQDPPKVIAVVKPTEQNEEVDTLKMIISLAEKTGNLTFIKGIRNLIDVVRDQQANQDVEHQDVEHQDVAHQDDEEINTGDIM